MKHSTLEKIVKESFKSIKTKSKITEELSADNFERMSGLVFTRDIENMIKAAESMMKKLTDEGYEVPEIREFFTQLIANDI